MRKIPGEKSTWTTTSDPDKYGGPYIIVRKISYIVHQPGKDVVEYDTYNRAITYIEECQREFAGGYEPQVSNRKDAVELPEPLDDLRSPQDKETRESSRMQPGEQDWNYQGRAYPGHRRVTFLETDPASIMRRNGYSFADTDRLGNETPY